jgi:hypothetical protein
MLLIPLFAFNFEKEVISEIDNKILSYNPFDEDFVSETGNLATDVEDYVSDRIGFRDNMITAYTVINDKLFGEMAHPLYMYGKSGYVFNQLYANIEYTEFHSEFAKMIKKIQDYCEARDVPFVFVFEPSKASVMTDKLASGINYNRDWVNEFFAELDSLGVHYIDNTEILTEKYLEGEVVFNQKYNAGHWNDLGAFYGVNNIISYLQQYFPSLEENDLSDYMETQKLRTTLPTSKFPIYEFEDVYEPLKEYLKMRDEYYEELEIDESHNGFNYIINPEAEAVGSPKTLVFQGSYMNGMGHKFLQNAFGEYIAVHNYINVTNFDYYFNIFKPECVVFEVTEYTLNSSYFPIDSMKSMELNPNIEDLDASSYREISTKKLDIEIKDGKVLSVVTIDNIPSSTKYAYLKISNKYYDLRKLETGEYQVTVEAYLLKGNNFSVIVVD